ncbi:shikimate dehydrogenase [Bacillus shivajii]|uniref:shikimate dehydrogenase n=1 Tax=Bacillus shivajii TaxID=1983719 RepID=UPI001CFA4D6E|nr:shikimate dehydrogenase [Bacillus shivajii]UCZ54459.1 shikimate dehydrogenase [Bacillus shivajii]
METVLGVIGSPISHSLSPIMHKAAYDELGLDYTYHAFHVESNELKAAIDGVKGLGLKGLNVTIPHKVSVIQYLDHIDPLAKEIGAVNTIVNDGGTLIGYNTDGEGYVKSLINRLGTSLTNRRVLIIGAGGASKAVALSLAKSGVETIGITNRTLSKAEGLSLICSPYTQSEAMTLGIAQARLTEFDIIINTTSIGMTPDIEKMPISLEKLSKGSFVSDLIYNPFQTRFLCEAEKKGANIMNGVDMFVYQGALAFEKWFDKEAPIKVMKDTVLKNLGGVK